jgi:tetratricopeptide (TPR) repeat protein
MKKFLFFFALVIITSVAYTQVRMPAPSPTEFIRQDFGLSSIELTYSRPSLKGRKIIGVVEPWNVLWRTGANAATKITFNDAVKIGDVKLDSGSYAIYTIPQKNGTWQFIINKGYKNSGVTGYNESDDVLRMDVKAGKNAKQVETLTMQFGNILPESCVLNISWEDFNLAVPITTNIKDRVRAQLESALMSDKKPYWQAAQYYNDYENNKAKALEMINMAIAQNSTPLFYQVYYKAKLQKELGDKKGAIATAKQSLELSKAAKNDTYVLMNKKLIEEIK